MDVKQNTLVQALLEMAERKFQILRETRMSEDNVIGESFYGELYTLGYALARKCETPEEFKEYFEKLAMHPVGGLWVAEWILDGAKNAKNVRITPDSIDTIADTYYLLPYASGGLTLFANQGEEFVFEGGTYKIIGYNRTRQFSPVRCQLIKGEKHPNITPESYDENNVVDLCRDSVAASIDAGRLAKYDSQLEK